MPAFYSAPAPQQEPQNRFYPPQGANTQNQPPIPGAPTPRQHHRQATPQMPSKPQRQQQQAAPQIPVKEQRQMPEHSAIPLQKPRNARYFEQRHPLILQRLYAAADTLLDTYPETGFIYDAYPDYVSLRLLRNRLLRDNRALTEEFLQAGCPIEWLEFLTDTVLSELLCRRRMRA